MKDLGPGSASQEAAALGLPRHSQARSSLAAGCDRNSYSLYCAELMANMKDVPSTERMVLCSQQWKLLSQKEKDAYHKKCDQVRRGSSQPWGGGTPGEPWGCAARSLPLGPCVPCGVVLGLASAD